MEIQPLKSFADPRSYSVLLCPVRARDLIPEKSDVVVEANPSDGAKEDVTDAEIIASEPAKSQPENDNISTDTTGDAEPATSKETAPANANDPSSAPSQQPRPPASPYQQTDLDADQDGVIDHRPDDPGIGEDNPKKEGWLF